MNFYFSRINIQTQLWIKVPNCFPEWLYHFTFLWGTYERAGGSKFLVFFMLAILTGVCWDLTMFLGYISLIVKILYIFSCAYWSSIYLPWWNCLLKTFVHFPIQLFLTVDIREFLIYSGYKDHCWVCDLRRFSPQLWLVSTSSSTGSFTGQKLLIWQSSTYWFFFPFISHFFWCHV